MHVITKPPTEPWPHENGITTIVVEALYASWENRTGPENIRLKWQQVGVADVLDTDDH